MTESTKFSQKLSKNIDDWYWLFVHAAIGIQIAHLKLDYYSPFFLQMKNLPVMKSQNTGKNLQEMSPVKTKRKLRLPQQVCLEQGCKIDLESCDVYLVHVPTPLPSLVSFFAEVIYFASTLRIVILSFPFFQSHYIKGNSLRGLLGKIQLKLKLLQLVCTCSIRHLNCTFET